MRRIWLWLIVGVLILTMAGCGRRRRVAKMPPPPVVEEAVEREERIDPKFLADQAIVKEVLAREHTWERAPIVLVVHKETRKMSMFKGTRPIKMYPVVLGHNPRNDKLEQGDRCTPEGVYRVVTKYPHAKWDKFILLNYPTAQNWKNFADAKRKGLISWDAKIGGDIGIHGTEYDYRNILGENWTYGCVALKNGDINEVYGMVRPGTIVVIQRK